MFEILLVEDNLGDVRLTEEALKQSNARCRMNVVHDGEEAMAYLRHEGSYKDKPCPDLILLDLNLPKKSGREVLAEIKTDLNFKLIPVIILTTSNAERDVLEMYELQANSYICKPVELEQYFAMIKQIEAFWLGVARLPKRPTR